MRTIITPTDFSGVSLNAVNYAADLAVAINAELLLVNIIQIPMTVAEIPLTEFEYDEMTENAAQELTVLSSQLLLRTKNKIRIYSKTIVGSLEHQLAEICDLKHPFAVVMGKRSTGRTERFIGGSKSLFAVKNLHYPVLIIPQNASFSGIKKITLAYDLKEIRTDNPVEILKDWLKLFKSDIDIINVLDRASFNYVARKTPDQVRVLLSEFHPHFHFIPEADVVEGIDGYIRENSPDLLVILPHRRNLFASIFHASKSKEIVLQPHIAVLALSE